MLAVIRAGSPREAMLLIIDIIENFGSYMCRILQRVLVVLIFILFGVFSLFYLNRLFETQRRLTASAFWAYYLIGVWILYNLVYNYVMAHRIGPGSPDQIPNKLLRTTVYKRCRKCNTLKPVRTHHCSICDSCNLQMDRNYSLIIDHCPWMGTCIGHHNRRFFIKFLTYLVLACLLVMSLINALLLPRKFFPYGLDDEVYMFMLSIGVVIGLFGLYHWVIALIGRTTLETCQILDNYEPKTWAFLDNF